MIIDKNSALRRTPEARFYESIGRIFLGMSKKQLFKLYGQPTAQENKYHGRSKWIYGNAGISVDFEADIATQITMNRNSCWRFNKTGLDFNSSFQAYHDAYGMSRMPYASQGKYSSSGAFSIGSGEYLFFNNDSITLSIFNN